ncbi:MAG: hypothetical protein MI865_00015 [Proteobacteria bacterium]|nr:hypothetical protein [Pseudomonadota bacterium]
MNIYRASIISFFLIIAYPLNIYAEYDNHVYMQKLILLEGKHSRLMDGDHKPKFNFRKKAALPYFLARGWKIQHIYINESSYKNNISGYAVIEKEIMFEK